MKTPNGGTFMVREKGDPALPGAGRPPKSDILKEVAEMMDGDGWAVIEGDLLDENEKPTGQKVKIRARIPNAKDAARAWMAKVRKADPALLKLYMEYTHGKPKQFIDLSSGGEQIKGFNTDALSVEELRTMTDIFTKINTTAPNE